MRQECRRLEGEQEQSQRQLEELQTQYDEVVERLRQQSTALVGMLGGTDSSSSGADEGALAQVGVPACCFHLLLVQCRIVTGSTFKM